MGDVFFVVRIELPPAGRVGVGRLCVLLVIYPRMPFLINFLARFISHGLGSCRRKCGYGCFSLSGTASVGGGGGAMAMVGKSSVGILGSKAHSL